jgi:hypothetical protein
MLHPLSQIFNHLESQEYAKPVLDEADPDACIEPEYRHELLRNDRVFAWKVVRMVARTHLDKLSEIKARIHSAIVRWLASF